MQQMHVQYFYTCEELLFFVCLLRNAKHAVNMDFLPVDEHV